MIGISSSSRSFAALGKYLVNGRDGPSEERVAWTTARNLPTDDPQLAAKIMRASASQNLRVKEPVYHLALSFDPRDAVSRATMERVADRVLSELKLKEHQAVIVAHGDRAHSHVHILVNRVHPETGKVWDRWQDYSTIQRALREEEQALGLRRVERGLVSTHERDGLPRDGREELELAQRARHIASTEVRATREERDGLRRDLGTYVQVTELAHQRHIAERGVAAARAYLEQLDFAVARSARAEAGLDDAIRRAYRDPATARVSFLSAVEKAGAKEASRMMREQPEQFGELKADQSRRGLFGSSRSTDSARLAAREASALFSEVASARVEVARLVDRDPAQIQKGQPPAALKPTGEHAHERLSAAQVRLDAVRSAELRLPARDQMEARLVSSLQRLAPPEFARFERALRGQHLNVARKLRQMVRDAALGRDGDG